MSQHDTFSDMFAPEQPQQSDVAAAPWKILLVDDESDIHAVLKLSLQDLVVEGRSLLLFDAGSAEEAKEILSCHPDIALILLDVVMETECSGLDLVRHIRQELDNSMMQIVLVTGQPGYAPQRDVVINYRINGYCLKSELTADKIFVSVYTALRNHQLLQKHHSILQSAMDGFWRVNSQGELLEVNDAYCRMSGYSKQELLTMHASELDAHESREDTEAHIRKVMETGHDRFVTRHMRKDGSSYDVEASVQFRTDGSGEMVAFLRDISTQLRIEQQLHQAQKMESVGRLAGGVAHDFNNMLSVIMGHAELASIRLDPNSPVCPDLREIIKTAERSADLTRQLLAFARKQTVMPKIIDLNDAVTSMLKMLQRLIGEDIQLTWQPLPCRCQVKIDPSQIDQILANLCVNARDAIEDTGRITIGIDTCTIDDNYCATTPEATPGDYVRLVVSDDGKGMDQEIRNHIFEPFYTTKELGKGTGLGLATVYGAIKQNNGFITISSEPGKGTTFSIYLPRYTGASDQKAEGAAPPVAHGQETILLVEDEAAILKITALMLEKQGYTVLKAESSGRAIELAREHNGEIHLLLTDVVMPDMNGGELARNILAMRPGMKRLFMSGYTADVIAHHGVLDDDLHFIHKPFTLPNMAAKVREVLDKP